MYVITWHLPDHSPERSVGHSVQDIAGPETSPPVSCVHYHLCHIPGGAN